MAATLLSCFHFIRHVQQVRVNSRFEHLCGLVTPVWPGEKNCAMNWFQLDDLNMLHNMRDAIACSMIDVLKID